MGSVIGEVVLDVAAVSGCCDPTSVTSSKCFGCFLVLRSSGLQHRDTLICHTPLSSMGMGMGVGAGAGVGLAAAYALATAGYIHTSHSDFLHNFLHRR